MEQSNNWEGIYPLYKDPGMSSFDMVRRVKRITGIKKVGHGGTLDPFAEGLLIIGVGREATKKLGDYLKGEKEYIAHVKLGMETDTYDRTGKIIRTENIPILEMGALSKLLENYRGVITQTPPAFSAVKVGGRRAYKLARKGVEVKLESRIVTVHDLNITELFDDGFKLLIRCSHGTYIRSLAHDIGQDLGCGAILDQLCRTSIGDIHLDDSLTLEEFASKASTITAIN